MRFILLYSLKIDLESSYKRKVFKIFQRILVFLEKVYYFLGIILKGKIFLDIGVLKSLLKKKVSNLRVMFLLLNYVVKIKFFEGFLLQVRIGRGLREEGCLLVFNIILCFVFLVLYRNDDILIQISWSFYILFYFVFCLILIYQRNVFG